MWSELLARGIALKDIQAYVTLRGSLLSPDDKKRVLLDVDAASSGQLTIDKVSSAIRMLGAGFFHEITGGKRTKGRTYDQSVLLAEGNDIEENSATLNVEGETVDMDDDTFDTLVQDSAMEGDEDAHVIQDFESATADLVQSDPDLASAYTVYTEARRRLSEKFRSRGFWPISKGKSRGFGKGVKGKFNKGHSSSRQVTSTTHPGIQVQDLWSCRTLESRVPISKWSELQQPPKPLDQPKPRHRLPVPEPMQPLAVRMTHCNSSSWSCLKPITLVWMPLCLRLK